MTYYYNSIWAKLRRKLGIRDAMQVCDTCGKVFFNYCPSDICFPCWEISSEIKAARKERGVDAYNDI